MKTPVTRLLTCALLLAAGGVPAFATPQPDLLITAADVALDFSADDLTANDGVEPGTAVAVAAARHGSVSCRGRLCTYVPAPGFAGVDRFAYALGEAGALGGAEVDVQVIPLVVPLAGDWNGDGTTDLGWFHARFHDAFFVELPPRLDDTAPLRFEVRCDPFGLAASDSWPLVGDWDGDGTSDFGLFDPRHRDYYLYRRSGEGVWEHRQTLRHPVPDAGGLPVIGDWDGDGVDDVGLFLADEHRFLLALPEHAGAVVHEVALTDLADDAPWWPVAGDWYGDGSGVDIVAAWNPRDRVLRIPHGNSSGPTFPPDVYAEEGPGLFPFAGRWLTPTSIGFYDPHARGGAGQFVVYPCDFTDDCIYPDAIDGPIVGGRRPILLPPPDDPVVTSCAGSSGTP